MTVNIDFFISPAYRVPPIRTTFLPKLMTTKVPVRVPCRSGSAWKSGAWSTVNPGRNWASSAGTARMNMLRTKSACHAFGVMNLTGRR